MLDLFTFREFLAERVQIDVDDDDDDDVEEDEMVDVEVYRDRSIDQDRLTQALVSLYNTVYKKAEKEALQYARSGSKSATFDDQYQP